MPAQTAPTAPETKKKALKGALTFSTSLTDAMRKQAEVLRPQPDTSTMACGDDDRAWELWELARDHQMALLATKRIKAAFPEAHQMQFEFSDELTVTFEL